MPNETPPPIEPLFAQRAAVWLRVWGATQAVALVVACVVAIDRAGGWRAFLAAPSAGRTLAMVLALVAYHGIGLLGYGWMLRRPWAVALFVPLGWVLVVTALERGGAFGLLLVGAVIQGFLFLPFAGAMAALALAVGAFLFAVVPRGGAAWTSLVVARVVGVVATGTMIGTVLLYIHRANRHATIQARLLAQLEAAQRDLAARAREAGVQAERQRLARDLHDTLAQGFTSVIQHLEAAELSFETARPQLARPHLAHAQAVSRASLAEIRRLVWALRPPQLAAAPLATAIARVVEQWAQTTGVEATCALAPLPPLQPDAEVVFLRATQEALANVARHAGATRVAVALHDVDGLVLLSVEDDGRGFVESMSSPGGGTGLAGMRERVRPFGGRVLIESTVGAGTSLTVALPRAAAALAAWEPGA